MSLSIGPVGPVGPVGPAVQGQFGVPPILIRGCRDADLRSPISDSARLQGRVD